MTPSKGYSKGGLGLVDEPDVSKVIDEICVAEGVAPRNLLSITVGDGEISVRYATPHGCFRTSTYPIVAPSKRFTSCAQSR